MERKKLAEARANKHWTLEEAAERIGVNLNTLNRWEKGKVAPQAYNIKKLCSVYGMSSWELDLDEPVQASVIPELALADIGDAVLLHIRKDLIMSLLAVVFEQHSYREVQNHIRYLLEEHDNVNKNNETYRITRRDALRRLATLPFIASFVDLTEMNIRQSAEEVITTCSAGITACWELSKSAEEEDLILAYRTVSAYIPPLKAIVKNASTSLDAAKNLLAQSYHFKTVLGWHLESLDKAMEYAQQALVYSETTSDVPLQITIHTQLSWLYYYARKSKQSLDEIQIAAYLLKKSDNPLPPNLYSSVQSTLAIRQAMYGQRQQAITSLRFAHDQFFRASVDRAFVYVDYERPSLILEDGMTYMHLGEYKTALDSLAQIVDPQTLSSKMPVAERVRVEALNNQSLALLKSPKKDMEQVINTWSAGIQEASKLQSTQRFNEAATIYEIMQAVWPGEKRIGELQDLIVSR